MFGEGGPTDKDFKLKSLNASVGKWAGEELGNGGAQFSCRHTDVHVQGIPSHGPRVGPVCGRRRTASTFPHRTNF